MNPEIREAWVEYHKAVIPWICDRERIDADMLQVALEDGYGVYVPPELIDQIALPYICNIAKLDVGKAVEYVENPTKCTDNPFTYDYNHSLDTLDEPTLRILLEKRVSKPEELIGLLDDSIKELDHPQYCPLL
jgi:hypothetical protein